jgi:uncharacterized OB-fold protein
MTNTSIRLVDDSLFTDTPQGVALLGSRCVDCAAYTFPRQGGCPRCTGSAMEDVPFCDDPDGVPAYTFAFVAGGSDV